MPELNKKSNQQHPNLFGWVFPVVTEIKARFKKKEESLFLTEEEKLKMEYEFLIKELYQREHNFEFAEQDYVDVAISELDLTHRKLGLVIKNIKKVVGIPRSERLKNGTRPQLPWLG